MVKYIFNNFFRIFLLIEIDIQVVFKEKINPFNVFIHFYKTVGMIGCHFDTHRCTKYMKIVFSFKYELTSFRNRALRSV